MDEGCPTDKISPFESLYYVLTAKEEIIMCGLLAEKIGVVAIIHKSGPRCSSFLCRSKCWMSTSPS